MTNDSTRDDMPDVPDRLKPPCDLSCKEAVLELWAGDAELNQGGKSRSGRARVFLDLLPYPRVSFDFNREREAGSVFEAFCYGLTSGELTSSAPVGPVKVQVTNANGTAVSGPVEECAEAVDDTVSVAKYLVINGPKFRGTPISSGSDSYCGRVVAEVDGAKLTVDSLSPNKLSHRDAYCFTHTAEVRFDIPPKRADIESISDTLFRTLSLMRGRWAGIVGPWLYKDQDLIHVSPSVTKTSRRSGNHSWCPDVIGGVFEELLPCLHSAYQDPAQAEAIQTGFHWLIESEQCAGGVEGALVLQQAALESLSWYEVVQKRELCSVAGFQQLPASDKIRWFTSLYSIRTAIPSKCHEIAAYANEYNLADLVEVLADVRNALVHGTPKKVAKVLGRKRGDEERTELWYQVGGIVEQAVLATAGYAGKLVFRDIDAEWTVSAIKSASWADKVEQVESK